MILHIATREAWRAAERNGAYHHESLAQEGFIHCSTIDQVLGPANEKFHGQEDLKLLIIAPHLVEAAIVYEDSYESGQAFPHIYGSLNLDAVIKVIDFPANADGSFTLPAALIASF